MSAFQLLADGGTDVVATKKYSRHILSPSPTHTPHRLHSFSLANLQCHHSSFIKKNYIYIYIFPPATSPSGYRLASLKRSREGWMVDGSGERVSERERKVWKRGSFTSNTSLCLSLHRCRMQSVKAGGGKKAGGGQGEQQYGREARRQGWMKGWINKV